MEVTRYERKLEEVTEVIGHAKLAEDDLAPQSQALFVSDSFDDYRLLELNSSIQTNLSEGQRVVFQGEKHEKAVLCTENETYEILEAETSNTLLLVPELIFALPAKDGVNQNGNGAVGEQNGTRHLSSTVITGVFNSYLELRKMKPRLRKLEELLSCSEYRGSELEEEVLARADSRLYSREDLLTLVQASSNELDEGLRQIAACQIDGKWRLLDFDYCFRVLSQIQNLVDSNSWPLNAVPENETVETLKDIFPEVIVRHVFHQFTSPQYERNEEGDALFELTEDKVCRFLAEALLRPLANGDHNDAACSGFDLQQFLAAWQHSVPEGMETNVQQLAGLAVIDDSAGKTPQVKLLPEKSLPEGATERLQQLFSIRQQWTLDEIQPYIEPVAVNAADVNRLLMKHARSFMSNGKRCYTARHGQNN
ncbi:sister chromatid cohesion protein DCC1 [Nilaparvata lugens]|uniref:sister chromatid cohesion protein DCC1 n=1 Tax=Nilaparvata lugens TaxID=108931 RepID=UPI000B98E7EB|nr:sister chromatid cohesion protein DCC1 [Nilaparvata lugens]